MGRHPEADLGRVRTYPASQRHSLVSAAALARPVHAGATVAELLDSLPGLLKARELLRLADAVVAARRAGAPVIVAAGAHVIKVGLSPLLIDLMEHGLVTAVALNGAGVIHDLELALHGRTSEDVDSALDEGSFGFAADTAQALNGAVTRGHRQELGYGESVGAWLDALEPERCPHRALSIVHAAYRLGLPLTVHVALGTDIVHQHPDADGAAIGATSLRDFRVLAEVVRHLAGGVWLNVGSAVLLPEVFLKALSVARNLHGPVEGFTTANLDMIPHYRPLTNVVRRPTRQGGSVGLSLTGHHEILVPLLCAAIHERWSAAR
jgi:hypothetical protein